MFGGGKFGGHMIFRTEVVNGVCPTCQASVVFVSLAQYYLSLHKLWLGS